MKYLKNFESHLTVPKNIYAEESTPIIKIVKFLVNNHSDKKPETIEIDEDHIEIVDKSIYIKDKNNKVKNHILWYGKEFVEGDSSFHYVYEAMDSKSKELFLQISNGESDGTGSLKKEIERLEKYRQELEMAQKHYLWNEKSTKEKLIKDLDDKIESFKNYLRKNRI